MVGALEQVSCDLSENVVMVISICGCDWCLSKNLVKPIYHLFVHSEVA